MFPPILVQFEFHENSEEAASLADSVHHTLNDENSISGLRIPTLFPRHNNISTVPNPHITHEAKRVLVVMLADDHLASASAELTEKGHNWKNYLFSLYGMCKEKQQHYFMPVEINEHAHTFDKRFKELNFLSVWKKSNEERKLLVVRRIMDVLLRQIISSSKNSNSQPLKIFLSYAKKDTQNKPEVVKKIISYLKADQPYDTWFDAGSIVAGTCFAHEIDKGIESSAFVIVLTDSYSSRSWCRQEIIKAKKYKRPIIIVDALQKQGVRLFPYLGNVPFIKWSNNPSAVIDLLLKESLRQAYALEILKEKKKDKDTLFSTNPELLTLTEYNKKNIILYPDPPLGQEELNVIKSTGILVETPLERKAHESNLKNNDASVVAISVSEAEDIKSFGLRFFHLEAAMLEISRYLLIAGVRLAYGGVLGTESYTEKLSELLFDPNIQHSNKIMNNGDSTCCQLINYFPWPSLNSIDAKARISRVMRFRTCERPSDIKETMDPLFVDNINNEVPVNSPIRRFAWARGLTEMRNLQTKETDARIVVGGRLGIGQNSDSYRGKMPGTLEEIMTSIEAKKPVFLVGAYGGCANLAIEAIRGNKPVALTNKAHDGLRLNKETRKIFEKKNLPWIDYNAIFTRLHDGGYKTLSNGLGTEQNEELASIRSTERIVELILIGLKNSLKNTTRK